MIEASLVDASELADLRDADRPETPVTKERLCPRQQPFFCIAPSTHALSLSSPSGLVNNRTAN